ncbi:hypothetical protein [uncultured Ruminobacter sp.]|uniref:hypothetical protein n=1 Tax=uncultured Ruminobacter sp. TaxID=538947 RepID=UPI002635CA0D|nr:hypothetical protein [uncultured Ruminobacter sp.]
MLKLLLRALMGRAGGTMRFVLLLVILGVSYFVTQKNSDDGRILQPESGYGYEQSEERSGRGQTFRNARLLRDHYEKHGKYMGFSGADSYQAAAARVVNNPRALHKYEKDDGDDVYYLESTNEIVIVSRDGYIRTYFNPNNGIRYYNSK